MINNLIGTPQWLSRYPLVNTDEQNNRIQNEVNSSKFPKILLTRIRQPTKHHPVQNSLEKYQITPSGVFIQDQQVKRASGKNIAHTVVNIGNNFDLLFRGQTWVINDIVVQSSKEPFQCQLDARMLLNVINDQLVMLHFCFKSRCNTIMNSKITEILRLFLNEVVLKDTSTEQLFQTSIQIPHYSEENKLNFRTVMEKGQIYDFGNVVQLMVNDVFQKFSREILNQLNVNHSLATQDPRQILISHLQNRWAKTIFVNSQGGIELSQFCELLTSISMQKQGYQGQIAQIEFMNIHWFTDRIKSLSAIHLVRNPSQFSDSNLLSSVIFVAWKICDQEQTIFVTRDLLEQMIDRGAEQISRIQSCIRYNTQSFPNVWRIFDGPQYQTSSRNGTFQVLAPSKEEVLHDGESFKVGQDIFKLSVTRQPTQIQNGITKSKMIINQM